MKQKSRMTVCVIVLLALLLCPKEVITAKAKSNSDQAHVKRSIVCRLKGGFDINNKTEIDKGESGWRITQLEQGKVYRLKKFLDLKKGNYLSEELRLIIKGKSKQEVELSGSGFSIKKHTFRLRKEGLYLLKVVTKEKNYVFPVCAVSGNYKVKRNEIAKISISIHRAAKGSITTLIEDPDAVQQIVDKLNRADYVYDASGSRKNRVGNTGFTVGIHWKDGRITELRKLNYGGFTVDNEWVRAKWSSDSLAAKEFVDYIGQVFDEYVPEHKGERSIC